MGRGRAAGRVRHLREVEQTGGDEERVGAPLAIPHVELARLRAAVIARVVIVLDELAADHRRRAAPRRRVRKEHARVLALAQARGAVAGLEHLQG